MTTPATTTTIAGTTTRRYVAFCRATLRHTYPATTTTTLARSETQTQFSQYTKICIYEPGSGLVELSH